MGLAASQARLLTITARKADCEFESMTLSHQKLALSRDMERVSTEYQNAINQTKLVYDYYGSGDKQLDLTYGLLMEPSIYNDYVPRLVTDPQNRVILNGAYAAAARAAGIPAEGLAGLPSSDVRDTFIEALGANNIISTSMKDAILAIPYNNAVGFGGGISATTSYQEVSFKELLERIEASCEDTSSYGLSLGSKDDTIPNRLNWDKWGDHSEYLTTYDTSTGTRNEIHGGVGGSISLEELLSGNTKYVLSMEAIWGERTPIVTGAYMQDKLVGAGTASNPGSFLNWLNDQFSTILGGIPANDTALQYAYDAVYDLVCPSNHLRIAGNEMYNYVNADKTDASDRKHKTEPNDMVGVDLPGYSYRQVLSEVGTESPHGLNDGYQSQSEIPATTDLLGFYFNCERNTSGKTHRETSEIFIDLNNLAQVYLTAFVQYMSGIESSPYNWSVGKMSDCNLYNSTRDKDFKFMVAGEVEVDDGSSDLFAQYYDTLFNKICANGWTENDNIEDKEYMQELLKNGMAFISTMSNDGFYYQGNYATDRTILEVTDTEAVARAQAKYNREKANIEYKEDRIDLKMKNLDTEISSLTTEYDTTKQLITKTVEKSFKRYDA